MLREMSLCVCVCVCVLVLFCDAINVPIQDVLISIETRVIGEPFIFILFIDYVIVIIIVIIIIIIIISIIITIIINFKSN